MALQRGLQEALAAAEHEGGQAEGFRRQGLTIDDQLDAEAAAATGAAALDLGDRGEGPYATRASASSLRPEAGDGRGDRSDERVC